MLSKIHVATQPLLLQRLRSVISVSDTQRHPQHFHFSGRKNLYENVYFKNNRSIGFKFIAINIEV